MSEKTIQPVGLDEGDSALEDYRKQTRAFYEALAEGLTIMNRKGEIIESNQAACSILGLTLDQLKGRTTIDKRWNPIHEDGSPYPPEAHPSRKVFQTGKPQKGVVMGVDKPDGTRSWLSISSQPVLDDQKNVIAVVTTFIDKTSEKRAQQALLDQERRFRHTLSLIGDNVWEHHVLSNETHFSDSLLSILGVPSLTPASNVELWWKSVHPADKIMLEKNDKAYKEGRISHHALEYRVNHADGGIRWVLDRGVVTQWDANGKPLLIVGTHTDITAQKQLQQQVMAQEFRQKKELVQAVREAQERERKDIAYELNENINQLLSSCKLMMGIMVEQKKPKLIEDIYENIDRAINEVRDISTRLSTSTLEMIGLPQAITDLIEKSNNQGKWKLDLDATNYKNGKAIDSRIQLAGFRVLQEYLVLLANQPSVSDVAIELEADGGNLMICVEDNGAGFDLRKTANGTGWLNIKSRVDHFNGKLSLKATAKPGHLFKVYMPLKLAE